MPPAEIRNLAYTPLIRMKLKYPSAIWDLSPAHIINDIESVQNQAARFILSNYSSYTRVSSLKAHANLQSPFLRHKWMRLRLLHILYHHTSLQGNFFQSPPVVVPRGDHHFKMKNIPRHKLQSPGSFISCTITKWNSLPSDFATKPDPVKFHEMLRTISCLFISSLFVVS